jgi:hypothetical protein
MPSGDLPAHTSKGAFHGYLRIHILGPELLGIQIIIWLQKIDCRKELYWKNRYVPYKGNIQYAMLINLLYTS